MFAKLCSAPSCRKVFVEEEAVVGDMLRQTEVGQTYALGAARHDCDNGKDMTIERFAQLCVQGGI